MLSPNTIFKVLGKPFTLISMKVFPPMCSEKSWLCALLVIQIEYVMLSSVPNLRDVFSLPAMCYDNDRAVP